MEKESFKEFCQLCIKLADEPSYNAKTVIIKGFIKERSIKGSYNGNLCLLAKLLLPGTQKRVYNVKEKQLLKHFSQIFGTDLDEMISHFEDKGIVSDTIKRFFKKCNSNLQPKKNSTLLLEDVDSYLDKLAAVTKEEAQISVLQKICKMCTAEDLSFIIRLIKHDLRINAGPKHFFDALDPNAYAAYQASSNLKTVIDKWLARNAQGSSTGLQRTLSIQATLMTPVKPMLAEACKSVEQAFKKCPNGMFSEIKYDGERVQIHKDGDKFQYFSRSLKPVQAHKIAEIKDYIPQACPKGDSLILDGEVLLMDTKTNKPLPFGTLGIHKKSKFKDATVCYVIFDILQFNDQNLLNRPIHERRALLLKNVNEIQNRIIHSEMKKLTKPSELQTMLKKCFAENLEGLVVKDLNSKYAPGKRHWLKIKKDYLQEGAMADTADLVVLGAYYGTGNKGGLMSVFLMGCYDKSRDQWLTVAKCGNGHDDDTIKKLQKQLKMTKIGKDYTKIPSWLDVNRTLVPDFVCSDPKSSPVWEITGAEFSQSSTHTADGISIRFPRVTKIRNDKDWKTATNLIQLKHLYEESKKTTDVTTDDPEPLSVPLKVSLEKVAESSSGPSKSKKRKFDVKEDESEPKVTVSPKKSSPKKVFESSSSPGKSKKRKSDAKEDESEPKVKAAKKKPMCQYGMKCYRKNKEHLDEFDHSSRTKTKSEDDKSMQLEESTKDLLNIFTNMSFIIGDDVKSQKSLKRYIIAYDGDVVPGYDTANATHIITDKITNHSKLTVISSKSILNCIKDKSSTGMK